MGDRWPLSPFQFWSSATARAAASPPAATTSAPTRTTDSQLASWSIAAIAKRPSRFPSATEIAIGTAVPIFPAPVEQQVPDQLDSGAPSPKSPNSGNLQIAITTSPSNKPQPSSPSSLPGLPSHPTPESHSPPQSSSPSPSQMASQTPFTPQLHSPSRLKPGSPKQASNDSPEGVQPLSPSKEPRTTIKEISGSYEASDKERPNSAVSKQESQLKPQITYDGDDTIKDQTNNRSSFKQDLVEEMSSVPSELAAAANLARDPQTTSTSQNLETPTVKGAHKSPIKPEEKPDKVKEVKEMVTTTEGNQEIKTEAREFVVPNSGHEAQVNEKTETSKPDTHTNKQDAADTKEISPASLPKVKPANDTFQPKKRSMISKVHNKSSISGGDHFTLQGDIRSYISKFIKRKAIEDLKNDVSNKSASFITLSGENKGALMQMGSNSSEAEDPDSFHRGYDIKPDESIDATPDWDGISEGKRTEDAETAEDQSEAYVNNNAQGINNSIVFDGSIMERNPGVHMAVVTQVPKEQIQLPGKTSPIEPSNPVMTK